MCVPMWIIKWVLKHKATDADIDTCCTRTTVLEQTNKQRQAQKIMNFNTVEMGCY